MEGLIRKIVVGRDPKDAMAYYVGMRAGKGKVSAIVLDHEHLYSCLLYTSPSPRDAHESRMPSSA